MIKVENAAYSGLCAERTALVKAVTSCVGHIHKFKAVGVSTDTKEPCSPCGSNCSCTVSIEHETD